MSLVWQRPLLVLLTAWQRTMLHEFLNTISFIQYPNLKQAWTYLYLALPSHVSAVIFLWPNHLPFKSWIQASAASTSLKLTWATPSGCAYWANRRHDICTSNHDAVFIWCSQLGKRSFKIFLCSNSLSTQWHFKHKFWPNVQKKKNKLAMLYKILGLNISKYFY